MKVLHILILLTIGFSAANAQKILPNQVPGQVGKAFRDKYPAAQQDSWHMEGAGLYGVDFFSGKQRLLAVFDEAGKWLETESEVTMGQLPKKVSKAFYDNFEGFEVQEMYLTETPDKGNMYKISVFKGRENYEVLISEKGEILKKEAGEQGE
jgi:hypothetical protein